VETTDELEAAKRFDQAAAECRRAHRIQTHLLDTRGADHARRRAELTAATGITIIQGGRREREG